MSFRPYQKINASSVSDSRPNNTGSPLPKGTPVRINVSGELDIIDVGVEAEAFSAAGVVLETIANGASGDIINSGKITDITTTAVLGDVVFVSKTGGLTNVKPSIGVSGFVAGDLVIRVGVIAKNEDNPSLKDLIVSLAIVAQL